MAHASFHKLLELREQRAVAAHRPAGTAEGLPEEAPTPRTVVVLRPPGSVARSTLAGSRESPSSAFPELPPDAAGDPHLLDDVDVVISTSGSSLGTPRLVGLSLDALVASATATHEVLGGPGNWVLALPAHHIAGAQVLFRAALAGTSPFVVDTTGGFEPASLLPAIAGATADPAVPGYLSLVPLQLRACLDAGDQVVDALSRLTAVLVGGATVEHPLMEEARARGIRVVTSFGMTETCGGCVYDGRPLPGVTVRSIDVEGQTRLAIAGDVLMTRYLGAEAPFIDEGGAQWLLTGDLGLITPAGLVEVIGRADDVITSGGLSISPDPVRQAVAAAPGVAGAWILGLPDDKWGEVLTAAVVPLAGSPGAEVTARTPSPGPSSDAFATWAHQVRDHAGAILGRAQAPRVVIAVPDLPLLDSGKIDPAGVRRLIDERLGTTAEWRR